MITAPIMLSCQHKNEQLSACNDTSNIKNQSSTQLSKLLSDHQYKSAILLIDSMLECSPDDPQIYTALGWIYDMQGNIDIASKHYYHAICIYDSLLHERKREQYSDEINRAFVYQLKEGPEVYIRIIDSISTLPEYKSDSINIEGYKHLILQNKEDLFRHDGAEMTPIE